MLRTNEVKIAYRFPNQAAPTIFMRSYNKALRKTQTLYTDGTILTEHSPVPLEVVKVVLASFEPFPSDKLAGGLDKSQFASKKRPYFRLKYVIKEDEPNIEDGDERLSNMLFRSIHEFIINHENAFVPDVNGVNINMNLGNSPLFDVIDETMYIRNEKGKNDLINKGRVLAQGLYKTDEASFIDLAYALNIPNIDSIGYSESLYNKVISFIDNKPFEFESIYNNTQRALLALLNRALYQPLDGGKITAIEQKAGYYMFNNFPAAKIEGDNREGLVNYFTVNVEALRQLEMKMGVFIPRTELEKLPDTIVVVKPDALPTTSQSKKILKEQKEKEYNVRTEVFKLAHTVSLIKQITTDDWSDYADKIKDLKEKNPKLASFIDDKSDQFCTQLKLKNPYKKMLVEHKKGEASNV